MRNGKSRQFSRTSVFYIVFGLALVGVMILVGISIFTRINHIIISGTSIYTPEQIAEASGVTRGDNLLYINTLSVSQSIRRELPYIDTVEISRSLPDTILITVTESTAVAFIMFSGDTFIIDSGGRVLEKTQANPGNNLIEVRGVTLSEATVGNPLKSELGAEPNLQSMQNILVTMQREGIIDDVDYLDVSNITNIYFGYRGIYRVIIGGVGDLRMKLSQLPSDILLIQERYPNTRGVYKMIGDSDRYIFTPE